MTLVMLIIDALLPRKHRCPMCGRRVGNGGLAEHVVFGHTPAEVDRYYATRGARR